MSKTAQMRANKKWRESNKEYFNEMRKPIQKRYYENHCEELKEKRMKIYYYQKIAKQFRSILLDP